MEVQEPDQEQVDNYKQQGVAGNNAAKQNETPSVDAAGPWPKP